MSFIGKVKNAILASDTTYIIKKGSNFWTGKSWNDEYPSAKIFKKEQEARKEKNTVLKGAGEIWKDYGFEHEELIY
jgi:hypothetical protein